MWDVTSDILLSPPISDEEDDEISSYPSVEFYEIDIPNPTLKLKMKFFSIQLFREAIRECNVKRWRDIKFEKMKKAKCVAMCRDPSCDYKVYGRQMVYKESFEIRSLTPKHSCTRVYKISIVNSRWIAYKLINKFKIQPDMSIPVVRDEMKRK
jgi:hypothetical protein